MKLGTLVFIFWLTGIFSGTVQWLNPTTHDFGTIRQHEAITHVFKFKNESGEAIVIDNVRPSCGCTSPDWSLEPIPPDSTGQIKIVYDARDSGYFYKKIKVYFSHQRQPEILYIEGETE